ncbi:hypothetical protein AYR62_02895 [Secundilactobacillus paracollinoides]|nr:hypothetical protein AYR62_02895 [Secundilactobacillus paracollinoides]
MQRGLSVVLRINIKKRWLIGLALPRDADYLQNLYVNAINTLHFISIILVISVQVIVAGYGL